MNNLKIAIAHDFLFQYGGAEKVVEKWLEMYPQAVVYTSFATPEKFAASPVFTKAFKENRVRTTWAQKIFDIKDKSGNRRFAKFQKHLFWLYPLLMRLTVLRDYYLVLISSTDCGKQVRLESCHKIIHYCHSPTRYLNGLITEADHSSLPLIYRSVIPAFKVVLRALDRSAVRYLNQKGCVWLANSEFIQRTIWEKYETRSQVVYPPIEIEKFIHNPRNVDTQKEFYLCHGRISFHKRLDLAIEACLEKGHRLVIGGTAGFAKQMDDLRRIVEEFEKDNPAQKGLVTFLGRTTDQQYLELLQTCKAFLFPGKEDFGISPIEVLAAGVPVIAYAEGGALEYIKHQSNGILFREQTVESLIQAMGEFEEKGQWNEELIRQSSQAFDESVFEERIKLFAK